MTAASPPERAPDARRWITGSHVYGFPNCARAVTLDLHGDRALRRPLRDEEELVLQRGRDHEARIVATLDYATPEHPERDFEAGAAATRELLQRGVAGVLQGVLRDPVDRRLGIADLLRREPGASDLGDWHYVVGDVKSSARVRGDQILQVAFYTELLAELQGRMPAYGYLVMKDGREERFAIADYRAVLREAVERIADLREDASRARPFLSRACDGCRWSPLCLRELEERSDLSLVHGMTAGTRTMLEAVGVASIAQLAAIEPGRIARRTRIESARLRRLSRAAQAAIDGVPVADRPARSELPSQVSFVTMLTDPFEERVLGIGALDGAPGATARIAITPDGEDGVAAAGELIASLPRDRRIVHFGRVVPDWFEAAAVAGDRPWIDGRLVDLQRRLRGAFAWPAPVFGLAELVRQALGRDPHRAGRAAAAACQAREADGRVVLQAKLTADLEDLRDLFGFWCGSAEASA